MGTGILRTISMGLCSMIYPLIKTFYTLFYQIARAKFLTEDTINSLSNNIYILISVVMLFSLGVQLLRSIVNPDLLLDNKKGTTAIVKRVFLSLCLIILIPMVFSYSFVIQDKIISSNIIEKLIVGYNSDKSLGDSNAGQIFAGIALNTVFYPQAESSSVEGLAEDYNKMINDDISLISDVGDYVNEKTDEDSNSDNYVFYFNGLIAIISGIFILYMLVLYCMDVGLRLVKLSFLQLTAPISIMAYIATGKDSLEKWLKEVLSTYLGLFVKIGALAFMLFAMGHIDEITGSFGDNDKWVKLFVLIGLLQFVHSAPDLILKLFGVKIGGRGGIRGRLGEMAAVGSLAQKGWDKVRKGAGTVAGVGALGLAGIANPALGAGVIAAGGAAGLVRHGWNKGFGGKEAWKNTGVGKGISTAGKAAGAFLGSGNPIKGAVEAGKIIGESDSAKERQYERGIQQANNRKINAGNLVEEANNKAGTGLTFKTNANGSRTIDESTLTQANSTPIVFQSLVKNCNFSQNQQEKLNDYNKKQNDLMVAQKNVKNTNQITSILRNTMNAETDSTAKSQINELLNKFENGDYANTAQLNADLFSKTSATLTVDVQSRIMNLANEINGGVLSTSALDLEAIASNKQAAFDAADSKLSEVIDNAGTEQAKENLRTMKAESKKLNKKNTKTI